MKRAGIPDAALAKLGASSDAICSVCKKPLPGLEEHKTTDHHGQVEVVEFRPWVGWVVITVNVPPEMARDNAGLAGRLKVLFQDLAQVMCFDCLSELVLLMQRWREGIEMEMNP